MTIDILIVDDEKSVRESLQDILELEGYGVEVAVTGEDGLEKLNTKKYEIMLLDLKMPGINGVEVMHQAHLLYPETKIIVFTGHGSLESAIKAIRIGAHDYILKPFEMENILASIKICLQVKNEQQRKEMLIAQLDSFLEHLKDMESVTTPEISNRSIFSLPQGIVVDLEGREIWSRNTRSHLTPTEGRAMRVFLENRGRVMPFEELVFLIKGDEVTEEKAPEIIRPIISRLRKKLAVFPGMEKWVRNVRGTGYVFEVEG